MRTAHDFISEMDDILNEVEGQDFPNNHSGAPLLVARDSRGRELYRHWDHRLKPTYSPPLLSKRGNHATFQDLYSVVQGVAGQNQMSLEITRVLNDTGVIFMGTTVPFGSTHPGQTNIASITSQFQLALRKEYPRAQIELIDQSSVMGDGPARHRAWWRLMCGPGDGRGVHSAP